MSLNRHKSTIAAVLLAVLALLAACGGGDDDSTNSPGPGSSVVLTPIKARYLPIVISDDLAVGEERFQLGLIDQETQSPVVGANLHLKFGLENGLGTTSDPKFATDATAVTVTKSYTHTHPDGVVETHDAGQTGAYIAYVTFDVAGRWDVSVTGTLADGTNIVADGEQPVRPFFPVSQTSTGLTVGDPAPPVKQTILSDVSDITKVDTSDVHIPEEHNMTVADAIASGKPTVIAFATPEFCVSLICGPTKQEFDDLYQKYKGQANFIHIEPYVLDKIRDGTCTNYGDCLVPAMNDFKLRSEPWVFVIDAEGKIAAKYDGIVSTEEMEQGLQKVLGGASPPSAGSG